jgi:NAD(P)H-hydrate epimerase
VPEALNEIFEIKLTEVMSVPLPSSEGHLAGAAAELVEQAADRARALALGPGLGRAKEAFAVARSIMEHVTLPIVIDADGLNALAAAGIEHVADREAPTVLTPHAGELGRLLDRTSDDVEAHRLVAAREASSRSNAIVVLKGDDTIVADPTGTFAVSRGGSPALATAGTGDVLTGLLAALLARGMAPFEAACAAVRAHVGAGRMAAESRSAESVIASDVIEALPAAMRQPA